MKVYFTGSLHNPDIKINQYEKIISIIETFGHSVQYDHILGVTSDNLQKQNLHDRSHYYKKLEKWIDWGDIIVAEISYPSTINIGHEVTKWLDQGKPVIGLYQSGREPGILQDNFSEKLLLIEYKMGNLGEVLKYGFDEAEEWLIRRFTMNLPSKMF